MCVILAVCYHRGKYDTNYVHQFYAVLKISQTQQIHGYILPCDADKLLLENGCTGDQTGIFGIMAGLYKQF